jgi:hypothetical protein
MTREGRVVVVVKPRVLHNAALKTYAARIPELGLTGYGDTHESALQKMKQMVTTAVEAHRQKADLAAWLDRSGVKWFWREDYAGALPADEGDGGDTAAFMGHNEWQDVNSELPIAA